MSEPSAQRNAARARELIERLLGRDVDALEQFTSNPAVLASGRALVHAFPDLEGDIQWLVADGDMTVAFHSMRGTQQGPWLFIEAPTGRRVETSFMLAFRFDDEGQIVDQWLGSNFIEMLMQLGWGIAPVGETVAAG